MKSDIKETLLKIKQAYKNNKTEIIEQIQSILKDGKTKDEFFENYPELQEVFEGIGNNPIESPNLYVAEPDFVMAEYVNQVEKSLKLDLENYPLEDALNFAGMVWTRVNSFRDETGHIKSTDNTKDAKMPTTKNLVKFSEIENKKREAFDKTRSGFDQDVDDIQDYVAEVTKLEDHYDQEILKAVLKITEIDGRKLSDWEKKLLVADVKAYAKDSIDRGKTSFKGYL